MTRHLIRLFIETVLALVLLLGLGAVLLFSRLDKGPIDLTPFSSEVASLLGTVASGLDFEIDTVEMRQGKGTEALEINLDGVTIKNADKQVIGGLKALRLSYAWKNFLTLMVVPHRLIIDSPSIHVTKFEDGHIGFNLQGEKDEKPQGSDIPEIAHLLARAPAALQLIRVQDAWIKFHDNKDNSEIILSRGLFNISRVENEIAGTMTIHVAAKDFEQDIKGKIKYDPRRDITAFAVGMQGFKLGRILALVPETPPELKVKMPVDILATLEMDATFQPVGIDLKLLAATGSIEYEPYITKEIPLHDFLATAHYNPQDGSLKIDQLGFGLLTDARADINVTRHFIEKNGVKTSAIKIGGTLKDFPLNDLKYVWPNAFAKNAQEWVTVQIRDGISNEAKINVDMELDADKKVTINALAGAIDFTDLTVDYLPPMPLVKHVNGHADFGVNNFDIKLSSGDVFDTKLKDGIVKINGLSQHDQDIDITLKLDGPIKDAIAVIAAKPLEFPQSMGLEPAQFSGNAKTDIWLKFPLRHDLTTDHVQMKTDAILDDLVVTNIVKDLSVSGSNLALNANPKFMSLIGKAKLNDANVDLMWKETFDDNAPEPTVITVDGDITPSVLKGLRLPLDGYMSGVANASVKIHNDKEKTTHVTANADVTKAGLNVAELSTTKAVGTPGKLSVNVTIKDKGPTEVRDINASWDGFKIAAGDARWSAAGDLEAATLNGLQAGRMRADIAVKPTPNGVDLSITGDTLDLSGYWGRKPDPAAANAAPDTRAMNIRLRGKTVYLDAEKPLSNMEADLNFIGDDLVTGRIAANVDKGELLMKQVVQKNGLRDLSLSIKNAGLVFQALDITDSVLGGTFDLYGKSSAATPKIIIGRMNLRDFTLIKAPILARLINAFSLNGLGELLGGKGIYFGRMQSTVILETPKTIRLKDGKMAGASLGLSFAGRVYRGNGTLNLKGNIVPIEGLNKAVGKIPLIGQILTGLKGEGLIAAGYRIKGPTENPEVTVNPLSVFTPGILRSIFFESDRD